MSNKTSIIIVAFLFSIFASAQSDDRAVIKQVDGVISQLKKQTLEVTFTVVYSNAQKDLNDVQYGKCLLKGEKFHLSMSGIDTYFDGKTQWVYMAADNEVSISEPEKDELKDISPIAMVEYYSKNHRIVEDTEHRTNDNLYINFFPLDLDASHFKISMVVDSKNKLRQITLNQKNGDKIVFNWDDIATKTGVENSSFVFNQSQFPKVYINDLR